MANTGADISDAPNFWRRMAVIHPASIKNSYTSAHPATPQRFLILEKTVTEINAKRAKGAPLVPEKAPEQPDEPIEPEETQ